MNQQGTVCRTATVAYKPPQPSNVVTRPGAAAVFVPTTGGKCTQLMTSNSMAATQAALYQQGHMEKVHGQCNTKAMWIVLGIVVLVLAALFLGGLAWSSSQAKKIQQQQQNVSGAANRLQGGRTVYGGNNIQNQMQNQGLGYAYSPQSGNGMIYGYNNQNQNGHGPSIPTRAQRMNRDQYQQFRQSNTPHLALFWAQWCGHCKTAVPEFEKAANLCNAPFILVEYNQLIGDENVRGFPTIRYYVNGRDYVEYKGARTAADFGKFCQSMRRSSGGNSE